MVEPTRPGLAEADGTVQTLPVDRRTVVAAAFEAHHGEIYSFLRRSTRDDEAAEDLLQDTFLRLTREMDAGRTPEHLRAWLYRVATNLAISRGRRHATALRWLRQAERDHGAPLAPSPEMDVVGRERAAALEAVLGELAPDARAALLLSANGFSGEEIAATIGRTHAATRTMLSRARVRVRLELERREVER